MSRIPAFNSTWSAFSEHLPWHFFRSIAGLTCRLRGRRAGCGMTRPGHLARTCKRVGRTRRNGLCSRWPPGRLKRPAHHHGGPRYFTSVPAVALRTFRHRGLRSLMAARLRSTFGDVLITIRKTCHVGLDIFPLARQPATIDARQIYSGAEIMRRAAQEWGAGSMSFSRSRATLPRNVMQSVTRR